MLIHRPAAAFTVSESWVAHSRYLLHTVIFASVKKPRSVVVLQRQLFTSFMRKSSNSVLSDPTEKPETNVPLFFGMHRCDAGSILTLILTFWSGPGTEPIHFKHGFSVGVIIKVSVSALSYIHSFSFCRWILKETDSVWPGTAAVLVDECVNVSTSWKHQNRFII